jgi:uracil phosphoribosyltransferase
LATGKSKNSKMAAEESQVFKLPQTNELRALLTIIRDRDTPRAEWIFHADRIIRLLVEEGLNHLPFTEKIVQTPTGHRYESPVSYYNTILINARA